MQSYSRTGKEKSCPFSHPLSLSNLLDPTFAPVMRNSTHFNLYPKHSGTLPDAAEGWQIVELITVWQVLFKCCSLPTALSSNSRLCADAPAEKRRENGSAGEGSRACWVAFGFTSCHQSHDSEQDSAVQDGGCIGDVTYFKLIKQQSLNK